MARGIDLAAHVQDAHIQYMAGLIDAERLQPAFDSEQNREVRKAVTLEGEPVYYGDLEFFSGDDACENLASMADGYLAAPR